VSAWGPARAGLYVDDTPAVQSFAITKNIALVTVLTWTFVVTILRSVRRPNDFAEAHWLLDYRFGFVKRGLVGTVVSAVSEGLGGEPTEQLITVLSGIAFVAFASALLVLGLRVIRRCEWSSPAVLAVLVFLSSPFVVMSAHLVGYFDNLLILLAVASIGLLLRGRIWEGAAVQAVSIFVHESSLLICVPVFCLAWLFINGERRASNKTRLPVLPLTLPIVAFAAVSIAASLFVPPDFQASYAARLSEFPFIQENRASLVPWWLTITFAEYYALEGPRLVERLTSTSMYGLVLPSMLALLAFALDAFQRRLTSLKSTALLAVCLVPQTLHAVAVDTPRIWTYSILSAFLAMWVCAEVFAEREDVRAGVGILFLAALVTNVASLTPLMDREVDRFSLTTRLLLYVPAIGVALALLRRPFKTAAGRRV
jgi:hypothetical protein